MAGDFPSVHIGGRARRPRPDAHGECYEAFVSGELQARGGEVAACHSPHCSAAGESRHRHCECYCCSYCTYTLSTGCYEALHKGMTGESEGEAQPVTAAAVRRACLTVSDILLAPPLLHMDRDREAAARTLRCPVCRRADLEREEVLLLPWACEGLVPLSRLLISRPAPPSSAAAFAVRPREGAVFDAAVAERYHSLRALKLSRAQCTERPVAHFLGSDAGACGQHFFHCAAGESFAYSIANPQAGLDCVWCGITLAAPCVPSLADYRHRAYGGSERAGLAVVPLRTVRAPPTVDAPLPVHTCYVPAGFTDRYQGLALYTRADLLARSATELRGDGSTGALAGARKVSPVSFVRPLLTVHLDAPFLHSEALLAALDGGGCACACGIDPPRGLLRALAPPGPGLLVLEPTETGTGALRRLQRLLTPGSAVAAAAPLTAPADGAEAFPIEPSPGASPASPLRGPRVSYVSAGTRVSVLRRLRSRCIRRRCERRQPAAALLPRTPLVLVPSAEALQGDRLRLLLRAAARGAWVALACDTLRFPWTTGGAELLNRTRCRLVPVSLRPANGGLLIPAPPPAHGTGTGSRSVELLMEFEGANLTSGMHRPHGGAAHTALPLNDTLKRILHSMPVVFSDLLRLMIEGQELFHRSHAGSGTGHISVFYFEEFFAQRGVLLSQSRLRGLLKELVSNRLVLLSTSEYALSIPQPDRLIRVMVEVTEERARAPFRQL